MTATRRSSPFGVRRSLSRGTMSQTCHSVPVESMNVRYGIYPPVGHSAELAFSSHSWPRVHQCERNARGQASNAYFLHLQRAMYRSARYAAALLVAASALDAQSNSAARPPL